MKKKLIVPAIMFAAFASMNSSAATLNAGSTYSMYILADGVSCFTFGDCTAGVGAFVDNDADASAATGSANPSFGSAIGGDGSAGIINISTTADGAGGVNFTVNSFNMDTYLATAGGAFATQGTDVSTMSGSVDVSGNISLNLTGRDGMAQFFNTSLGQQPWNTGATFTSGNQINAVANLTGTALQNDGTATLVSADAVGAAWGFFVGTPYTEVFSVQFTPFEPLVPIPTTVWLFGSGLIGLISIAKRSKG